MDMPHLKGLQFLHTKHWPIKMTWDKDYFRNHDRLYGSYATTDANMTQRYLYKDPRPWNRADIACLASEESYERVLLIGVLFNNWELPYYIEHEVNGIGKIDMCGIEVSFGRPWLGICDTITATSDFKLASVDIYPTITDDQIIIKNPLNQNLLGEIISLEGKIIHRFEVLDFTMVVDVSFLDQGLYIINLKNKESSKKSMKFLKK